VLMRNRERIAVSAPAVRGQWCNLCGSRLERTGGVGLPPTGGRHKVEWREATGRASTWSLCVQCYAEKLRCASCGLQVGTQAFMLEGETRIYCRHCFEQRPRCDTCGSPVGAHYWTRPDGRKLCDRCQSTAVADPTHAHTLYKQVRAGLARALGMALREPCQLKLVNRKQLHDLIEKSSLHSLDADSRGRCFGLFIREGMHRAVFVEYGLPQIVLLEVMTHEYAHAWQSENCRGESSPEIQEGFAEWVTYKLLQSWGCTRRSERMLRRDDVYGRGLKVILEWEKQGGAAEVFRRVTE
jgi:hypothetical protein